MMNNKTLIASLNTFIALALRLQTDDFKDTDTCICSVFYIFTVILLSLVAAVTRSRGKIFSDND